MLTLQKLEFQFGDMNWLVVLCELNLPGTHIKSVTVGLKQSSAEFLLNSFATIMWKRQPKEIRE